MSHDFLRSRYCFEELNSRTRPKCAANHGQRSSRTKCHQSVTQVRSNPDITGGSGCDEAFLRRLLAMNKKQELVLNKRLAYLLVEKEFGKSDQPRRESGTRYTDFPPSYFCDSKERRDPFVNEKKFAYERIPPEDDYLEEVARTEVQYDLHGWRIHRDSDNAEDETSDDESFISTEDYSSDNFKTCPNSPKLMKSKSNLKDYSVDRRKISSRLKSFNDFRLEPVCEVWESNDQTDQEKEFAEDNTQQFPLNKVSNDSGRRNVLLNNNFSKKCVIDSHEVTKTKNERNQEYTSKVNSKLKANTKSTNTKGHIANTEEVSKGGVIRDKVKVNQGDCLDNVVVHCCGPTQDNVPLQQQNRVLKVWNFNKIPKTKSENLPTTKETLLNRELKTVSFSERKHDKDDKRGKNGRNLNIKPTKCQFLRKKDDRPRTVC